MLYKSFNISGDPDIIGVKNGVYQIEIDKKNFNSIKELDEFCLKFPEDPNTSVNLRQPLLFRLLKGGKVNDFMFYANYIKAIPFIISERALNLIQNYLLKKFSLIEISISGTEAYSKHYLFRYPFTDFDKVKFDESLIFTGNELRGKKYHSINNLEDYLQFKKKNMLPSFEKIAIKDRGQIEDMLRLKGVGIFISPRLEEKLILNNISGIEIGERNTPIVEIK